MMGLSTHVLDTANGKPAEGIDIALYRMVDGTREVIVQTQTNNDGRTDQPLITTDNLTAGKYELDFNVEAYFKNQGNALADPAFLDVVTIRFGIANVNEHYHVPLLVSPWSYSTYRGS